MPKVGKVNVYSVVTALPGRGNRILFRVAYAYLILSGYDCFFGIMVQDLACYLRQPFFQVTTKPGVSQSLALDIIPLYPRTVSCSSKRDCRDNAYGNHSHDRG